MSDEQRYPTPGDAFVAEQAPLTIGRVSRLDEVAGRNEQRQFKISDQQGQSWLVEHVRNWTAGPRFVAIRRLNP